MSARMRLAIVSGAIIAVSLTACTPGTPDPTAGDTSTASPGPASTGTPSAGPSSTAAPADDSIELPAACEDVFSASMRDRLTAAHLPANDPTLTMPSTDLPVAVQMIESLPHLRCTWGVASEVGIATTVALVDAEQSEVLRDAYRAAGSDCQVVDGDPQQTRCLAEEKFEGEMPGAIGEIHVFRANAWLSTKWINADMAGYADDMVAQLWG
ncbi:hypothetical protein [Microbacterium sp. nov. GSS16]|uniref:hypothetical protein n=1 Tax=Microbacterium sp. nov. GSS16 TaxID=3019890 RepID=UPI002305C0A8|nr:hypothetical protein [Microbacterium sp. nov. GSS16]WCD92407.1 hypothetical protein PGB26_12220 [Microbacterium sp. nov. GSS16]